MAVYAAAAAAVVGVIGSVKQSQAQKKALNMQASSAERQAVIDQGNAEQAEANARLTAEQDIPLAQANAAQARKNADVALGNADVSTQNAGFSVENQHIAEQNAERATLQGLADSVQQQRVAYAKLSAIRANYGASGVHADGSAMDVLEASASQAELDRQNIEYSARLSHDTFINQARGFANQATGQYNQAVGFRNQASTDLNQALAFDADAISAANRAKGETNVATSYGNRVIGARETAALDRSAASTAVTNGYLTSSAIALQSGAKAIDYYYRPGAGTPIPTRATANDYIDAGSGSDFTLG